METMSVWLSIGNYHEYTKGELVYGWSTYDKNHAHINIQVPLSNVVNISDNGKEGIEIDIKKA